MSASSHDPVASPAARNAPGADLEPGIRRHITVMFTDIVGFTTLSEQIGEEAVFGLVRRVAAEQAESIRAHGGVLQRRYMAAAEHHLVEAADIARAAGTKGFLLQALTTLADAGLRAFRGFSRLAALAEARAVAEEIGAAPAIEHLDARSYPGLDPQQKEPRHVAQGDCAVLV